MANRTGQINKVIT